MRDDWARTEVKAAVADYFTMLAKALRGQPLNKSAHRRALSLQLNGRSGGSIEFKHANTSAVLIELGYPWLDGYRPRYNYQRLLAEVVAERVLIDTVLAGTVSLAVEQPAKAVNVADPLSRLEDAPEANRVYSRGTAAEPAAPLIRPPVNYLEREARNSSLGRAGEEFVVRYEHARLRSLGEEALADRIEQVSATIGDGAGFDIRSFEQDGRDRLIEVKTTAYGKQTPFFLSRNELEVSRALDDSYHLYRVFRFREDPRLYTAPGALDRTFALDAVQFSARIA